MSTTTPPATPAVPPTPPATPAMNARRENERFATNIERARQMQQRMDGTYRLLAEAVRLDVGAPPEPVWNDLNTTGRAESTRFSAAVGNLHGMTTTDRNHPLRNTGDYWNVGNPLAMPPVRPRHADYVDLRAELEMLATLALQPHWQLPQTTGDPISTDMIKVLSLVRSTIQPGGGFSGGYPAMDALHTVAEALNGRMAREVHRRPVTPADDAPRTVTGADGRRYMACRDEMRDVTRLIVGEEFWNRDELRIGDRTIATIARELDGRTGRQIHGIPGRPADEVRIQNLDEVIQAMSDLALAMEQQIQRYAHRPPNVVMHNDTPEYERRMSRRFWRRLYGVVAGVGVLAGTAVGGYVALSGESKKENPTPDIVQPQVAPPQPLGFNGCSVQRTADALLFQFPKDMPPGGIRLNIGVAGQTPTPIPPTGMTGGTFRFPLPDALKDQEVRVIMQFNDGTGWKQGGRVILAK